MAEEVDIQPYIDKKLVHEIHTSERKSFRGCRRRWDWHFRESLYPMTTAKPLEFGVAYHKGMEIYYNPDTWTWDNEVKESLAVKAFVDSCEEQRRRALDQNIYYDDEVEQDYNERVELGIGMMRYYFAKVAPKEDINWKPVKVEIAFMVPIPNPETGAELIWCKCDLCWEKWNKHLNKPWDDPSSEPLRSMRHFGDDRSMFTGLPVVYAGRLDMLAEDKHGNYWIFDWKTAATISQDTEFLYLDDQIGSYVWALRKLGLPIQGFVYHEQRKGYPQPPKENKTVRSGRKFSIDKTQTVDYPTYLSTVAKYDTDAWSDGVYDEMLLFLQNEGTVFYSRRQIPKSSTEVASIEFNIGLEALDIIDPGVRLYPNASRFSCKNCAFREPCMSKNDGGDFQYSLDTLFEKKVHYYVRETTGPSTESKSGE